ncbi:unnamed protein product [Caenorhabditis auriculariae]|uniref:BTB domain-containing protein n=1 Tax=Caenorhabditis auriculariae TaxID=2777116 RepID=A0A8S1HUB7_9PELO|nr:unnamed protein product [Caenorhabditis auriculariae]
MGILVVWWKLVAVQKSSLLVYQNESVDYISSQQTGIFRKEDLLFQFTGSVGSSRFEQDIDEFKKHTFSAMEFGVNERQIGGIELNDVTAEEFRHFLNAIYASRDGICAESVRAVLKLADMYEATVLFPEMRTFFCDPKKGRKIGIAQRLHWAAQYRMKNLQEDLYKSMNSLHKLAKLRESPEWINMCEAAKTQLIAFFFRLEKSFSHQMSEPSTSVFVDIGTTYKPAVTAFYRHNLPWLASVKVQLISKIPIAETTKVCSFDSENKTEQFTLKQSFKSVILLLLTIEVESTSPPERKKKRYDYLSPKCEHDEVVWVGNRPFYILSDVISTLSPVFRKIIANKGISKKRKNGIVLSDVTEKEFRIFMESIHGDQALVNEGNIETLLKLANQFDAAIVLRMCEQFIRSEEGDKISFLKRLNWASNYGMVDLQADLIESIESLGALASLRTSPDWPETSQTVKTQLLDVFFNLFKPTYLY